MSLIKWSRSLSIGIVVFAGTTVGLSAQSLPPTASQGSPTSAAAASKLDHVLTQPGAATLNPPSPLPASPPVIVQAKHASSSEPVGGSAAVTTSQQGVVQAPTNSAILVPPGATISVPTGFSGQAIKPVADDGIASSDMDPQKMVLKAVPMVQAVMLFLVLASILSWTLLVGKVFEIIRKGRSLCRTINEVRKATSLSDIRDVDNYVIRLMVVEARDEIDRSKDMIRSGLITGLSDRVSVRLQRVEDNAGRQMSKGLNVLATIGSITPFVGLFGTVWGIMHSFIGIAHTHTTSLAVVAPGIAEALLATSLGLLAAVPATIMYNSLGKKIVGNRARVADCISVILCLVSRDAERAQLPVRRPQIAAQG